ncbi:MAG: TatD family hydrolase [Alphaproteobacteria bacterium]|nr:TatD family hydrolase [Alphaproteobacteria bacterium]
MIDAHIHLSDSRFNSDREELIKQAEQNGVAEFFCVSARPAEWTDVLALAERHKNIHPFIGTHPWYAEQHNADSLKDLLKRHSSVGIGEIGLDTLKGASSQKSVFENQLAFAAEFNRPCVIHNVKSFDLIANILKHLKKRPPALLFHGYSGTLQQAEFLIPFNAFFSFSGSALASDKKKQQSVLASLPKDRILIETDAPDMLPPEKFRLFKEETRNVPANLPLIIQEAARIRKTDINALKTVLAQNAKRFLTLPA